MYEQVESFSVPQSVTVRPVVLHLKGKDVDVYWVDSARVAELLTVAGVARRA
jgi:hypothetical protein